MTLTNVWLEPSDVASSCVSKVNRLYAPSEVTCVRLTWSLSFLFLPACLHTPQVDQFGYGPSHRLSHRGHHRPAIGWLQLIYKPLPHQRENYPPFACLPVSNFKQTYLKLILLFIPVLLLVATDHLWPTDCNYIWTISAHYILSKKAALLLTLTIICPVLGHLTDLLFPFPAAKPRCTGPSWF